MEMICPNCNCDSLSEGSRQYESRGRIALRMGRFCIMCPYQEWDYISEAFAFDLFHKLLLSKEKEVRVAGIKSMRDLEKKIRMKKCFIKEFKAGESITFYNPEGTI